MAHPPACSVWLRRDFGEPPLFSLRFSCAGGIARLLPVPAAAAFAVGRGVQEAEVHPLNRRELTSLTLQLASSVLESWASYRVVREPGVLTSLVPGTWVELDVCPRRLPAPPPVPPGAELDPDYEPPPSADDPPTEGVLFFAADGLPPLDPDAPTDLSLLSPPMARIQALRKKGEIDDE